jgi:hypothetical protein
LERHERLAFARTLLAAEPGEAYPPVPGAERVQTHGARVAASLAGMFMELTVSRVARDSGPVDDRRLSQLVYETAEGFHADDLMTESIATYLVPRLRGHWRDGDFGVRRWPTYGRPSLWAMFAFRSMFFAESDRLPSPGRWTIDEIEQYWLVETTRYEDRRGRW